MAKSRAQLEQEGDDARKRKVDTDNKKAVRKSDDEQTVLAETPLNPEEKAFMAEVGPKMNKGRRVDMPSSADILRFSQLKARADVK